MASGSILGPREKVERSRDHIGELKTRIRSFFDGNPYGIEVRENETTAQREWVVTQSPEIPPKLSIVAGDALHGLRTALDYLIYQLALANGKKPDAMRTEFSIWNSRSRFRKTRPGGAGQVSKEALKLYYGLKPYRGGNDLLWRLHTLDIVDKHRLPLEVAAGYQSFSPPNRIKQMVLAAAERKGDAEMRKAAEEMPDVAEFGIRPADKIVVEKGAVLLAAPLDDTDFDGPQFNFAISLYETEVPRGEPLEKVLDELADYTEEVLGRFSPLLD